jgi:hypothetical protein
LFLWKEYPGVGETIWGVGVEMTMKEWKLYVELRERVRKFRGWTKT